MAASCACGSVVVSPEYRGKRIGVNLTSVSVLAEVTHNFLLLLDKENMVVPATPCVTPTKTSSSFAMQPAPIDPRRNNKPGVPTPRRKSRSFGAREFARCARFGPKANEGLRQGLAAPPTGKTCPRAFPVLHMGRA